MSLRGALQGERMLGEGVEKLQNGDQAYREILKRKHMQWQIYHRWTRDI